VQNLHGLSSCKVYRASMHRNSNECSHLCIQVYTSFSHTITKHTSRRHLSK